MYTKKNIGSKRYLHHWKYEYFSFFILSFVQTLSYRPDHWPREYALFRAIFCVL